MPNTRENDWKPHVSLARKGRQGGGRRQIHHLESLVFRQVVLPGKNSDGYKIDPAELFRVYPKTTKTDANEPASNDWQSGQADGETTPYQLAGLTGLKSLIAEKNRRITDLEADRAQLREDRHRLTENWQEERVRLLKLLEDLTGTVKFLTDERSTLVAEVQRTFWQRVFRRTRKIAA